MKTKSWMIVLLLLAGACRKEGAGPEPLPVSDPREEVSHGMIVLGEKLEDPYAVAHVTKALEALYPTRASRIDVTPTDLYVRFLPADAAQYESLVASGLVLMDHPLDYRIIRDGDYYHDPELAETEITWQYAVVPKDFSFPEGIRKEILDHCYIPENDPATRSDDGVDWEAVIRESYRLTGNADRLLPLTRAEAGSPKGRITVVDEEANGGKPFGVAGVRVLCNSFVKFSAAYTDRDGYYEIGTRYSSDVRYRLMFKNAEGFSIGLNLILVPASTSALGKGAPEGIDVEVTAESDRKLYCRCVVNNAVVDYLSRCGEDDLDISLPPSGLRIWILQQFDASSSVMLHHGAFIEDGLVARFLGEYAPLVKTFLPDITLGVKDAQGYATLYGGTCHELAHASHYAKVGNSYWNHYIQYILTSYVSSGGQPYGTGTEADAGYCEVGEMWGYFMQNKLFHDRYGGAMPESGTTWWFHPQILRYLNDRGLSVSQLFKAHAGDVTDREKLRARLTALYGDKKAIIDQIFGRYAE